MSSQPQVPHRLAPTADRPLNSWSRKSYPTERSIIQIWSLLETLSQIWSRNLSLGLYAMAVAFLRARNFSRVYPTKRNDIPYQRSSTSRHSHSQPAIYCYWLECLNRRSDSDHFVFSKSPLDALDAFLASGLTAECSLPIFALRRVKPPALETTLGEFELLPSHVWRPIPMPMNSVNFNGTESVIDEDMSGHFLVVYICDFSHLGMHKKSYGVSVSFGSSLEDIEGLFEEDENMSESIWQLLQMYQGGFFRVKVLKQHISLLIDKCWRYSKLPGSLFKGTRGEDLLIYVAYSNILGKVVFSEHNPRARRMVSL